FEGTDHEIARTRRKAGANGVNRRSASSCIARRGRPQSPQRCGKNRSGHTGAVNKSTNLEYPLACNPKTGYARKLEASPAIGSSPSQQRIISPSRMGRRLLAYGEKKRELMSSQQGVNHASRTFHKRISSKCVRRCGRPCRLPKPRASQANRGGGALLGSAEFR